VNLKEKIIFMLTLLHKGVKMQTFLIEDIFHLPA
jgi:hypothetical protein